MTIERPNYYSVLTANVRYDNRLTDSEKLMYSEITALTQATGECWASNNYFATLYDVSMTTISRRISKLSKLGYIKVKMIYKKGTKQIDKRVITLPELGIIKNDDRVSSNLTIGYYQNCIGGIDKNDKENNTSINNTSINKEKINKKEKYFDDEKVNELFLEFLEMRKKLKALNNERAITLLLNKLNKHNDVTKYRMIENSIMNSWKSVYDLKGNFKNNTDTKLPEWFDNELVKNQNDLASAEMEELLKEIRI